MLKIDTADVILNDLGEGQGKIIIADTSWGYNYSYFWGAMGDRSLSEFLSKINSDYFIGKLGPNAKGEINTKQTVKSIRKAIKEYFSPEYPWYKEKEFQLSLRNELRSIEAENINNTDNYFYLIERLKDNLDYYSIDKKYDEDNIKSIMKAIFDEPWHYLEYEEHKENVYLRKFHQKLVSVLLTANKNLQTIKQIENERN